MPQIFISHASQDAAQSTRLHDWLRAQGFHATFLDFDISSGIAAGASWEKTLYRELSACDAVLLILTANWFASKWCFVEFAQARALGKTIIPLIETPTGETLVSSDIQHLDLVLDRNGGLERLRAELTRISLNTRGGFPWNPARSPFPGLLAFDQPDAAIYFGRDDEIRRLIERLNARRAQGVEKLVAVLGASGAGKSSLLRAGVLPRLARDPRNWIILPPFRPQLHPLEELAQSIANALQQPATWKTWRTALSAPDPGELHETLSDLSRDLRATHDANEAHILLSIDQAEELFTADALTTPDSRTSAFFRVLNALLDDRLPFLAVLTLRSDYLGRLQAEPRLTAPFEQFSLKPMPFERVREIILGPARVAGLAVDDALVTAAMADARTEDALPLLAFTLRELYDRAAGTARLTLEAYSALGDPQAQLSPLENAVRRKADEVLAAAKPTPEALDALKQAFIPSLVRIDAQGDYVRRAAPLAAIPPLAIPLMERLSKARLLTIRDENGASTVEVAHEALLRKWPLLRGWLDDEREFIVGKDRLQQELADWTRTPPELQDQALLAGLRLTLARTWLAEKPQQLTPGERSFIDASIVHQEAAAERLRQIELGSQRLEDEAQSRRLATEAFHEVEISLAQALSKAIRAFRLAPTSEAVIALHAAMGTPRERLRIATGAPVLHVAFSPDGQTLLTVAKHAQLWDSKSGALLQTLDVGPSPIRSASLSSDGALVVTGTDDGSGCIWSAVTGERLRTLTGHTGAITHAIFSANGDRILTASHDRSARLWDATTGADLLTISTPDWPPTAIGFSPDGTRIVVGTREFAQIWNAATGDPLWYLDDHQGDVFTATFSQDGRWVLTAASGDRSARLWRASTGKIITSQLGKDSELIAAAISPENRQIMTAGGSYVNLWWAEDQSGFRQIYQASQFVTAQFLRDEQSVLTTSRDLSGRVWSTSSCRLLYTLPGHTGLIRTTAASPLPELQLATGSNDQTARVWDAHDLRLLFTIPTVAGSLRKAAYAANGQFILLQSETLRGWNLGAVGDTIQCFTARGELLWTRSNKESIRAFAEFSPDASRVLTAGEERVPVLCETATGRPLAGLGGSADLIYSASFSPDGTHVVAACADKIVRIWSAEDSYHAPLLLEGHSEGISSVSFSPNGCRVLTADSSGTTHLWDMLTHRLLFTFHANQQDAPAPIFSPDGRDILVLGKAKEPGSEGPKANAPLASIWDAESGNLRLTLNGYESEASTAVYSPGGDHILTYGGWDRIASVWDAKTGLKRFAVEKVWSTHFSPGGETIATACTDGNLCLYRVEDGRRIGSFNNQPGSVMASAFSPDGATLLAGSEGKAHVYALDPSTLLSIASLYQDNRPLQT